MPEIYSLAEGIRSDTEASISTTAFISSPVRYTLISGYPGMPSDPIPRE